MSHAAPSHFVWWLAGRSAGLVALALITASVLLGLAMAARILPQMWRRDAVRVHQQLALVSLGAIAAHGLLLAMDPWLRPGVTGVTVPFTLGYRPLWTGLGIIAGYLAVVFALSFYVRRRIGARTWRRLHRFTALVYVLGLAHALGSGTDAALGAVRYALLASAVPIVVLLGLRVAGARAPVRASAKTPGAVAASRCAAAVPGTARGVPQADSRSGASTARHAVRLEPTAFNVS